MAKKEAAEVEVKEETTEVEEMTEVFVLCDCPFGKCGQVVEMATKHVEMAEKHGMIDTNEAAIKAAKK